MAALLTTLVQKTMLNLQTGHRQPQAEALSSALRVTEDKKASFAARTLYSVISHINISEAKSNQIESRVYEVNFALKCFYSLEAWFLLPILSG